MNNKMKYCYEREIRDLIEAEKYNIIRLVRKYKKLLPFELKNSYENLEILESLI